MRISIEMTTENAAFDYPRYEITRILGKIIQYFTDADDVLEPIERPLLDANGNSCGVIRVEPDKGES